MPTTAGELAAWLSGFHPDTPVVVDVNTDEAVYLRVEDIAYTSDEGNGPEGIEVQIFWEPPTGWVQRLLASANETRAELGMPPLAM
jgi:hypothetical protein